MLLSYEANMWCVSSNPSAAALLSALLIMMSNLVAQVYTAMQKVQIIQCEQSEKP